MGKTEDIETKKSTNFIRNIIDEEILQNKHNGIVHTRFPPEPNGYLHIGHAKSICLNFGIAKDYNGLCNLRFDDTNPDKEDVEFVDSIQEDIKWLGFDWGDRLHYTSDYFDKIYEFAIKLIKANKAYVCDLNADEMRKYKGTLTTPGKNSPYRERSVEENIDLLERMKNGEFEEGSKVLRAKIDMTSPNLNFRDPVMYRIIKASHHRTGTKWGIYPSYDFAHGQSDSIENITNSICTLEFEDHRPLYNWFIKELDIFKSRQIEFARLNITYTVMSKRKLLQLVENKLVSGWDDPRMPTIAGLRRRGYTAESIRTFCDKIGVAKSDSTVDISFLEFCLREDLNQKALRVMAVMDPVKVVITNYPKDKKELLPAVNNQNDEQCGNREIPFGREIYIERNDFMIDPPKKFFRLTVGKEVRLLYAYYVTCTDYDVDENGKITEIKCTYDPDTKGGWTDKRKVKGTLHWVSKDDCFDAPVYNYDHLFTKENPYETTADGDFMDNFNKESLQITTCKAEPSLKNAKAGSTFQFLRNGYFTVDTVLSKEGNPVFNKTVGLKDSWSKKK